MGESKFNSMVVCLFLVLTLMVFSVAGCTDTSEPTETTTTPTETTTAPPSTTTPQAAFQGMYSYDDFDKPDTCGSCHTGIYADWSKSLMATNYIEQWKQAEYFDLAYPHSQQLEKVAGVESGCIMCHAPLAFLSGDIPPSPPSAGTRANEGVTCEVCHSMTGSTEEKPFNFSAIMNLGDIKYGPRDDSESTYHETQFSDFIGSPEHCAVCHDEQSPYGAWVKATYREWLEGPFPGQNITCVSCHMDSAPGTAAIGGKERDAVAQHTFMAVHSPEKLEGTIEITASVDSSQASAGDTINISVDLRALLMGHKFPSGSTEERMLWLEVWAVDSNGSRYHIPVNPKGFALEEYTIADSTAIAYSDIGEVMGVAGFEGLSRDGDVPDGARIFRQPFFNPHGEMTILQWYCEDNTSVDYRFGPRETKTETFTWQLPGDIASGPITIELDTYFSLVPSSVGEYLGLEAYYYAPYHTGGTSVSINTEAEEPGEPLTFTFGELAANGEDVYWIYCSSCHGGNFVGPNAYMYLFSYRNADALLDQIWSMPNAGQQANWELLSFWLIEYGWVSEDATFDPDTLDQILTPRP